MTNQDDMERESQGSPENSGESSEGENQMPKSLVDRATELNTEYKMISKSTDGKTLNDARAKIRPMISEIEERIKQIKAEGRESTNVSDQKVLYSEYKELDLQLERLVKKDEGIDTALTELTVKQKEFFGIKEDSSKKSGG
jgi:hypothetical protein